MFKEIDVYYSLLLLVSLSDIEGLYIVWDVISRAVSRFGIDIVLWDYCIHTIFIRDTRNRVTTILMDSTTSSTRGGGNVQAETYRTELSSSLDFIDRFIRSAPNRTSLPIEFQIESLTSGDGAIFRCDIKMNWMSHILSIPLAGYADMSVGFKRVTLEVLEKWARNHRFRYILIYDDCAERLNRILDNLPTWKNNGRNFGYYYLLTL